MVPKHLPRCRSSFRAQQPALGSNMQHSFVTHERVLSHQLASTSGSRVADTRAPRFISGHHKPIRTVFASATQSPPRPIVKPSDSERKDQGAGPGRVFLSSTRAAAGQLWGVLKFFQAEEQAALGSETDSSVLGDATKRAAQVTANISAESSLQSHWPVSLTADLPCRPRRCRIKQKQKRTRNLQLISACI